MRRVVRLCLALALLLSGTAGEGRQSPAATPRAAEAVRRALDSGLYSEAERLATAWAADVETGGNGLESIDSVRAADLLIEAQIKAGKSNAADLVARAERAVSAKQRLLGRDHPEVAVSLHNLGALRVARGEFEAATTAHRQALAIRRNAIPPGDPAIAESLENLAVPLIYLEQFADAQQAIDEAKRIRGGKSNSGPMALTHGLYVEALLHRSDGQYAVATAALDQVFAIFAATIPNHPDLVLARQLRGDLYLLAGDVGRARTAWTDALTMAEHTLGGEHPIVPMLLRLLAVAAKTSGDLALGRQLLERASKIAEKSLAPCDKELPTLLNDFANFVAYDGGYSEARKLNTQALAKSERCLGPTHSLTATILYNRAVMSFTMGDLAESEQLYERAVRAWSGLRPDHPYVARGLDGLAETLAAAGRLTRARTLLERALALRRRDLGADHPDVAVTLVKLAQMAGRSGDLTLALKRVNDALTIYEKGGLPSNPDYLASALTLRGDFEGQRGDYTAARADYATALTARERVFGSAHPLTARARAALASSDFALQASDNALTLALDAERVGRDHLRFTIRSLPERQALAYADKRPHGLDVALSLVAAGHVTEPLAVLDSVIQSRGVILDELAARAQLTAGGSDPQLTELNATVKSARERFANLMMRSLSEDPVRPALLAEARQNKENAERALAEQSVTARGELSRASVDLGDVRRALPPDTALVSFVLYDRTTFTESQGRTLARHVPSYIAFVARPDSPTISAVPLGSAATIESLVKSWHDEAGGRSIGAGIAMPEAERTYRVAGVGLRQRIWDPLTAHFGGASKVFIVPDGAINLVSFAALPIGTARYLAESGPVLHLLSTERDLVSEDAGVASPMGRGLLAVGGPSYDLAPPAPVHQSTRGSGCVGGPLRFEDLPGSRAEVRDVSQIWSSSTRGAPDPPYADEVMMLNGRDASKGAVVRAASGRRVVHLATHGFFLGSPCEGNPGLTRSVGGLKPAGVLPSVATDNPLLVAGLAFAGANRRATARAQNDGILTAEEVAGLNLQGTEWAVLSACDTGLGEIHAGEGVFGLRRAFQIAGARTVIMSLWSVEDQSTRSWMRALYEGRFERHLSTADAVHDASLRILQTRRANGQSTHPFYWAAFVAAGNWK